MSAGARAAGPEAETYRWRRTTTDRLRLDAVSDADTDDLYALHADPAVWQHFPQGRHLDVEHTRAMLARFRAAWDADGLGYWTVRERDGGAGDDGPVGIAGCMLVRGAAWNLYYRFRPSAQGRGLAGEAARAAIAAARAVRPDLPVTASLLEHNARSRALAEGLGLELAHRGPDPDNPDPDAVRLVYADRELDAVARAVVVGP